MDKQDAPIRLLGVPTRGRPALLARTLETFFDNAKQNQRALEILVVDDIRQRAIQQQTRRIAARFGARYVDRQNRLEYAKKLAKRADLPLEPVRFALLGDRRCSIAAGAARNCLLLAGVGERLLFADDDLVCRIAPSPGLEPGLRLSSLPDPTAFFFFAHREEMLHRTTFVPMDLIGQYEKLLGTEVGRIATKVGWDRIDCRFASGKLERDVRRNRGRVPVVMAGVVGDSGIGSTAYLFIPEENRARLLVSEERYRAFVANRQVLRAVTRETIGEAPFLMAGSAGFDHRELLPPFTPVQRNAEGNFARILRRAFPTDLIGYLPFAVWHDPAPARSQSLASWRNGLRRIRFPDLLRAALQAGSSRQIGADPAQALRDLGAELIRLSRLPGAEFDRAIRLEIEREQAPQLARDRSQEQARLPDYYAALRLEQLQKMREALVDPAYLSPSDLADRSEEARRRLAQELIGRCGRSLEIWPRLREAALDLKRSGVRL